MKKTGVIFFCWAWIAGNCPGAVNFSYLNNPAGARPAGMAEAFTGMPGNIDGLFYDPAALSGIKHTTLSFSHIEFLQGVRYEYAVAAIPLAGAVLGAGAVYVNNGVQERRDINGVVTGDFTPYQIIPQLTVAAELLKDISLGLSFKLPYEVIDDYSNYKPFFDIGINAKVIEHLYAGASARNLGTSENTPAEFRAGLAYTGTELNLCADLMNIPEQGNSTFSVGLEVKAIELLVLRAGYRYKFGAANDTLEGLTAGFGVRFDTLALDYGYKLYDVLGATHFFSLTIVIN